MAQAVSALASHTLISRLAGGKSPCDALVTCIVAFTQTLHLRILAKRDATTRWRTSPSGAALDEPTAPTAPTRQDIPVAAAAEPPSDPSLASILAAVHAGSDKSAASIANVQAHLTDTNANITNLQTQINTRFDVLTTDIQANTDKLVVHDSKFAALSKRLDESYAQLQLQQADLRKEIAANQATTLARAASEPAFQLPQASGGSSSDWRSAKDPHKVQISANEYIPREGLLTQLNTLLEQAKLEMVECIITPKSEAGKNFTLQFTETSGAIHAKQFLDSLRLSKTEWKRIKVERPGGTPADIYFNPDKSPNQRAKERKLKILKSLLEEHCPSHPYRKFNGDGTIVVNGWTTAVSLLRDDKLKWGSFDKITLDIQGKIETAFNDKIATFRK